MTSTFMGDPRRIVGLTATEMPGPNGRTVTISRVRVAAEIVRGC
jgi:hypothetical protein